MNSGQGRFLETDYTLTPEAIENLKKEINENLKPENIGKIFTKFKHNFDKESRLYGCGTCGIRGFEMGSSKFRNFNLRDLGHLKLNEEQLAKYQEIVEPYRSLQSVFKLNENEYYYIHPELVKNNNVKVCSECSKFFTRPQPAIPPFSIAAGVDFGLLDRLNLPKLTLVEELLIARSRLFVNLVKLTGHTLAQRQTAKKSNVITFPQPEGATKTAELQRLNSTGDRETYPRKENLKEHLAVFFLGSRLQYEALIPFLQLQELTVRVNVVYQYLYMLKQINPLYRDIIIDQSPAMIEQLESITSELLHPSNVEIMENEIDIYNDAAATGSSVTDTPEENLTALNENQETEEIPIPSTFVTRMTQTVRDENQSRRDAFQGKFILYIL